MKPILLLINPEVRSGEGAYAQIASALAAHGIDVLELSSQKQHLISKILSEGTKMR